MSSFFDYTGIYWNCESRLVKVSQFANIIVLRDINAQTFLKLTYFFISSSANLCSSSYDMATMAKIKLMR